MGYFPFFMDITGKTGVVAGGGKVAARKVEKLLSFGPRLIVVAPEIEEEIRAQGRAAEKNKRAVLCLIERAFTMTDLDNADFVIAATDDEALNGRISDYCRRNHIPVNVVDDREKCSFFFPALVKEGDLTIGISTDGKSPAAASWVRKEIARALPQGLGKTIDLMGQMRPLVMQLGVQEKDRKHILEELFLYSVEKGGEVTVKELAERLYEQNPNWHTGQ